MSGQSTYIANGIQIKKIHPTCKANNVLLDPAMVSARTFCEGLMHHGILSKDTHGTVVRFAPPLIITPDEINRAVKQVKATLAELEAEAA